MRVCTDRGQFREIAAAAPNHARIPIEVRARVPDPFTAYRKARRNDGVYLETTGGQPGWGYFAVDPISKLSVSPAADVLTEESTEKGFSTAENSPSLTELDALLASETLIRGDCSVPYPCGAIGWLSYDIARELESLPTEANDDRQLPHLQVGVFDRIASWREPHDTTDDCEIIVTACPRLEEFPSIESAYDGGLEHARSLIARAIAGDRSAGRPPADSGDTAFRSECTEAEFSNRVSQVQSYIRDGDTFQTNISQRLRAPATVHPVDAFAALRKVNPAPYSALLEFPGIDLVSASPELLLEVNGEQVITEPIAGTRPRGSTAEADDQLEKSLRTDEKEEAEHAMLVDLERNDLGKISEYGSVTVDEYRRVDRYSEVMHLVSIVTGRRRPSYSIADTIAATFPGGTITGAPKPRTMEIIEEVEPTRRGPYTGSIGIFGFDNRATLNIIIRTLVRVESEYFLRVGAGIVHDSDPIAEFQETLDKGRALVNAIDDALDSQHHFDLEVIES